MNTLAAFKSFLSFYDNLYLWKYSTKKELLETNCSNSSSFSQLFLMINDISAVLDQITRTRKPVLLSTTMGLLWMAAGEWDENGSLCALHAIGPITLQELSEKRWRDRLGSYPISLPGRARLSRLLTALPCLSIPFLEQYGLLLHYSLTGKRFTFSDIQTLGKDVEEDKIVPAQRTRDRNKTYLAERSLLNMIREGNLNYRFALDQAAASWTGIVPGHGTPAEQAANAVSGFITLCMRAAIEGGLSPSVSYELGDLYQQSLLQMSTVTDIAHLGNTMYEDFIKRVHEAKPAGTYSRQIKECCDYMVLHIEEKITLEDLARLTGYHPHYLAEKFRAETGETVMGWLRRQKIERSKLLLTSGDKSIQEISALLHFSSYSHFASLFRKTTGITPGEYRKQAQSI